MVYSLREIVGLNLWEKSMCLWSFWQESRQFPCIGFYLPDSHKGWEASARVGTWGCILPPTLSIPNPTGIYSFTSGRSARTTS